MMRDPGNVRFTAPEMIPDADPNEMPDQVAIRPTFKSDIFSLGILLLQVCLYSMYASSIKLNNILDL